MKSLKGTKTLENLMKAWAGESQAVVQYGMFAARAKKEGYVQISNIFQETADNEREHGKRFYRLILKGFEGEIPAGVATTVTGGFIESDSTLENLHFAVEGETDEAVNVYPGYRKTAEEEGFTEAARAFEAIASVEQHHADRFRMLADNIENGAVFQKGESVLWKCNNCGYVTEGTDAPEICPACLHPRAHFQVEADVY